MVIKKRILRLSRSAKMPKIKPANAHNHDLNDKIRLDSMAGKWNGMSGQIKFEMLTILIKTAEYINETNPYVKNIGHIFNNGDFSLVSLFARIFINVPLIEIF